jgi:hypothetical protein
LVRQIIAAALLGITLRAATGGSTGTLEQPAASPAPPSSTAATPSSTVARPQALSRAQAAKRYLAIVKPYNVALERLEQAFNAGRPLGDLRTLSHAVANANDTQMDQLRATLWPTAVRQPMRSLLAESAAAQPYWLQAAEAGTRDELARALVTASRHDGSDAASQLRRALGLGAYDEGDYSS